MNTKKNTRLSFDQFVIENDHYKKQNVFFVYGPEAFQRNETVKLILKLHKITEFDSFDSFIYYGDDFSNKANSIKPVIEQLQMYPFAQPLKTVVIRNFDEINSEGKDLLVKYALNPNEHSLLVLAAEKADLKTTRMKKLIDCCISVECKELRIPSILTKWVIDELKKRQLSMDDKARMKFLNTVDLDFYTAFNELSKLELFIGSRKIIHEEDVQKCTVLSKTFTVFELLDELGYLRKAKALTILDNLIANEESAIMILSVISNFFMTLWKLSALRSKKISDTEIKTKHMNEVHPYYRDKYFIFLKNYPKQKIEKALDYLLQSDRKAKLSMCSDHVLLTILIYNLTTNN